jgi:hypothetical protein
VRGAVLDGPVLQGAGDDVGDRLIDGLAVRDGAAQRAEDILRAAGARWTSSLKVSEPNSSVALRWLMDAAFLTDIPKSLMLRMASPDAADPIGSVRPFP